MIGCGRTTGVGESLIQSAASFPSVVGMKKSTLIAAAALTGLGAVVVAPSAVADPRISVPFHPVSVPVEPPTSGTR